MTDKRVMVGGRVWVVLTTLGRFDSVWWRELDALNYIVATVDPTLHVIETTFHTATDTVTSGDDGPNGGDRDASGTTVQSDGASTEPAEDPMTCCGHWKIFHEFDDEGKVFHCWKCGVYENRNIHRA